MSLISQAASEDPAISLLAIRILREHLTDEERRSVALGREQGMTWEQIASLLGQSRQAVWARYH